MEPNIKRSMRNHPGEKSAGRRRSAKLPERIAQAITRWTGSSLAFFLACTSIIIWLVAGPLSRYSDTWQLVINTSTTIVTFLMVFLIQRTQNKDMVSLHLKLNELVAAKEGASNRLINVEDLNEAEIAVLHQHYQKLAELVKHEQDVVCSHSIEEAERRHRFKKRRRMRKRARRIKKSAADSSA